MSASAKETEIAIFNLFSLCFSMMGRDISTQSGRDLCLALPLGTVLLLMLEYRIRCASESLRIYLSRMPPEPTLCTAVAILSYCYELKRRAVKRHEAKRGRRLWNRWGVPSETDADEVSLSKSEIRVHFEPCSSRCISTDRPTVIP